ERLRSALDGATVCINLAAKLYSDESSLEGKLADYLDSSLSPIHQFFPHLQASLVQWIQISSISTYSAAGPEERFTEDSPLAAQNPYGIGKLAADLYLRCHFAQKGLTLQTLKFPDLYGEW